MGTVPSPLHPQGGGSLLWISFPSPINATEVFNCAAGKGLIIAPGALFSASGFYDNCIRLNTGQKLTPERSRALAVLGEIAGEAAGQTAARV